MLGPVVRVLVMVIAVVLGTMGVVVVEAVCAAAIFGVLVAFVGENVNPFAVVAVLLMLPLLLLVGCWLVIGARAMAVAARRVGFHRVDIGPGAAPTRVVAAGWGRRSVIEVADLTRVIVRHREPNLELVLRAGKTTLVCPATVAGPLRRVDPRVLADWLGEVLAPSEVPVFHCTAALPFPVGDVWLPANTVAQIWRVPVAEIPTLVDRCGVHSDSGPQTPRFNAYDVEACVERAQAIAANGQP
ncbi:hypothetical protein [Actinophytocola sp.]|uniref:hypothetical protein n=1 Tax=Actinophytocola sp. TaxID=1872138 RepID=UPI002ED2D1F7